MPSWSDREREADSATSGPSCGLARSPSAIRIVRAARSATAASCVITMRVQPSAFKLLEQPHHLAGCRAVEVSGGLVGEQHARPADHRPRHGDPLLLASGQRAGHEIDAVTQSDAISCARARASRSPPAAPRCRALGISTLSSTERCGIRWNAWKTNPMEVARTAARSSSLQAAVEPPASRYSPTLGLSSSEDVEHGQLAEPLGHAMEM